MESHPENQANKNSSGHTVRQGECLMSIARRYGFLWETLWNHPSNEKLRQIRKHPHILKPGDVVHIPEKDDKEETVQTGQRHRFKVKSMQAYLRLRLLDEEDQPRSNLSYTLVVDGTIIEGTTDGDGCLEEQITADARKAILHIHPAPGEQNQEADEQVYAGPEMDVPPEEDEDNESYEILLGHVDPTETAEGGLQRLVNLGYPVGVQESDMDASTQQAIKHFQRKHQLEQTGTLDSATLQKLEDIHKS